jgi:hypothetical protein
MSRVARSYRDVFAQPLDATLLALRVAGLPYQWTDDLKVWRAVCPACRWPGYCLTIREPYIGGPISLRCESRCSDAEIRAALVAAAHEIDPFTLEIAEDARDVAEQALRAAEALAPEDEGAEPLEIAS